MECTSEHKAYTNEFGRIFPWIVQYTDSQRHATSRHARHVASRLILLWQNAWARCRVVTWRDGPSGIWKPTVRYWLQYTRTDDCVQVWQSFPSNPAVHWQSKSLSRGTQRPPLRHGPRRTGHGIPSYSVTWWESVADVTSRFTTIPSTENCACVQH